MSPFPTLSPPWFISLLGLPQKCHRLGGLNNRIHFLSYRGWNSKIKVSAASVSPEAFLFALQVAKLLLCPHMVFSVCLHAQHVSIYISSSPLLIRTPADWIRVHTNSLILTWVLSLIQLRHCLKFLLPLCREFSVIIFY